MSRMTHNQKEMLQAGEKEKRKKTRNALGWNSGALSLRAAFLYTRQCFTGIDCSSLTEGKASERRSSNSGKHFVASAGCTHQASLLQVPWTTLPISPLLSEPSAQRDAFFMSGNSSLFYLYYLLFVFFCLCLTHLSNTFLGVEKKRRRRRKKERQWG